MRMLASWMAVLAVAGLGCGRQDTEEPQASATRGDGERGSDETGRDDEAGEEPPCASDDERCEAQRELAGMLVSAGLLSESVARSPAAKARVTSELLEELDQEVPESSAKLEEEITRLQRDRGLPLTGRIDVRTARALGVDVRALERREGLSRRERREAEATDERSEGGPVEGAEPDARGERVLEGPRGLVEPSRPTGDAKPEAPAGLRGEPEPEADVGREADVELEPEGERAAPAEPTPAPPTEREAPTEGPRPGHELRPGQ